MPLDPFFTSKPPKRHYSAADHAEAERLHALPFGNNEYRRLKDLILSRHQVSKGEFLFVRDIDQKMNWKRRGKWRANAKRYLGGNVQHNGAYAGASKPGSHARKTR